MSYVIVKPDELYHFGILGMKWGIRRYQNKDGSLTEAGKKHRQQLFEKAFDISEKERYHEDKSNEIFSTLGLNKNVLNDVRSDFAETQKRIDSTSKESNDLFKEFKNKETKNYWEATSEIANQLTIGQDFDKMTTDDLANNIYFACYSDGQQGYINAYSAYATDKGFADKMNSLVKEHNNAENELAERSREAINQEMEKLGDVKITSIHEGWKWENGIVVRDKNGHPITEKFEYTKTPTDLGRRIVVSMLNNFETKSSTAIYECFGLDKTNSESGRKAITQAKSMMANLGTNKNDRWENLNWAIDELGLDGVKCSDLTSSDWKKINDKLDELS